MPLTKKDRKLKKKFQKRYHDGESVYYATLNKRINEGRPIDTPESHHMQAKRKHHKKRKSRRM